MKKVFFNASVILAGLRSPAGGSGKVLGWVKKGKIEGFISEVVLDEVLKHAGKVGLTEKLVVKKLRVMSMKILPAPERLGSKYSRMVKDLGDVHLFVSAESLKVDYLVSLDKKHVLSLVGKVKKFMVVSPGELIERLG
jgi:predicted nucleic acid-binding protein